MAVTLYESSQSRDLSIDQSTTAVPVRFVATGSTDPTEVYNAVLTAAGVTLFGLVRTGLDLGHQDADLWFPVLTYTRGDLSEALQPIGGGTSPGGGSDEAGTAPGPTDPLGAGFSFTTGGGTAHIQLSRETMDVQTLEGYGSVESNNAIGLTSDSIDGVDIVTPTPEFSVTRKRRTVTLEYYQTLCALHGKTNVAEFWGFKRGELLYCGATGQGDDGGGVSITHTFRYAEDQPPFDPRNMIAPGLTITEKRGWSYVWARYESETAGAYPKPVQVFVERVYDEGDFSLLQLG